MGELTFKGIKVDEIDFTNQVQGEAQMDLAQRSSFNVKYTEDNLHCMANLVIDMMDKTDPMKFNFKFSATAFLDCEPGMDQIEIHKKAYDEIYPHVRALVATIITTAGLPPIHIPKVKMEPENIQVNKGKQDDNSTGFTS